MKKLLSTLLVASMLLSLVPAFVISADETEEDPSVSEQPTWTWDGDYSTIDDANEFAQFAKEINDKTLTVEKGTVVTVTTDLDMTGIEYSPIGSLKGFVLDFDGHTVSNINVTSGNTWQIGLIASEVTHDGNTAGIKNIKLKDCTLTVEKAQKVGAVAGYIDRATVENVSIENVTITATATSTKWIGLAMGLKAYPATNESGEMAFSAKDVTINAAEGTSVGIIAGGIGGTSIDDSSKLVITDYSAENVTLNDVEMAADAYVGDANLQGVAGEVASDYIHKAVVDADSAVVYVDAEGKTADTVCELHEDEVLAVGEAVAAQTKYEAEAEDGSVTIVAPANVLAGSDDTVSGGKMVGGYDQGNGSVTFTVYASEACSATLVVNFVSGNDRQFLISVNGAEAIAVDTPSNGWVWSGNAALTDEIEIELVAGANTITFTTAADQYAPSIDYIEVTPVVDDGSGEGEGDGSGEGEGDGSGEGEGEGSGEGEGEGSGEGEGEGSGEGEGEGSGEGEGEGSGEGEGEGSGEGEGEGSDSVAVGNGTVKIEAEDAASVNNDMELNADVLEDVSGSLVTSIGAAGKSDVQFTVDATVAGKYTLTIYYVTMGTRNIEISVNGGEAIVVEAIGNGAAWNGGVLSVSTEITLDEGENTIVIGNRSDWSPNLDYIELAPASAEGGEGPAPTGDVTVYALAISAIALVGTAVVVSKKRHAAE